MEIKAVLFDMDGVIIDSHKISEQLINECAVKNNISLDEEDMVKWQGLAGDDFWVYMKKKYSLPQSLNYYQNCYNYDEEIKRYKEISPIAGVEELIRDISAHAIPLALVTCGRRERMTAVMDLFNFTPLFNTVLSAEDVDKPKPDPEIVIKAAARLRVPVDQCIVIEDSEAGVDAAVDGGMGCIGFNGLAHVRQNLSRADFIISDFRELTFEKICTMFSRRK